MLMVQCDSVMVSVPEAYLATVCQTDWNWQHAVTVWQCDIDSVPMWQCDSVEVWVPGSLLGCGVPNWLELAACCDYVTVWLCDSVTMWQCDYVTMWLCGSVTVRWCQFLKPTWLRCANLTGAGSVLWLCDSVTMWQCDYVAVSVPEAYLAVVCQPDRSWQRAVLGADY